QWRWLVNLSGVVTQEALHFSKLKCAIIGSLDAVITLVDSLVIAFLANGSLYVLINNAAIPISMLVSKVLLRLQYRASQYFGALVVEGGVVLAVLPVFLSGGDSDDGASSGGRHRDMWVLIGIGACFPVALANIIKEKVMAQVDMHPLI